MSQVPDMMERRPRVNASLNGPMNREKMEGSVKVDNYMKESSDEAMSSGSIRLDKSQTGNPSALSMHSVAKSKNDNKSAYRN